MKTNLAILTLTAFVACGKKNIPLDQPFASIKNLAEHHLRCIEENSPQCLTGRLLTKQEFHNSVYQYLPEAKDGTISESDYWGWTLPDRQKAFKKLFEQYGGMKLTKLTVGEPKKVLRLGGINVHRDIPLYAEFFDTRENKTVTLISSDILKAVVEVNGEFKLWNTTYE